MDEGFDKAIQIANYKHDLIAIRVNDEREKEIPNVGMVRMLDAETGKTMWIDTSSSKVRKHYARQIASKSSYLDNMFARFGVDMVKVYTGKDYVKPLMNLFKKREARK